MKLPRIAISRLARRIISLVLSGLAGAIVILLTVAVVALEQRPDLEVWHEAKLDLEFTEDSDVHTLGDYLALEARLFRQLDELVYDEVDRGEAGAIIRFQRGSLADPGQRSPNWNRSFEWSADEPRAGVLLLHGLSDSPYSLRALAGRLNDEGAWVIGLRLPGHGTAPSGLTTATMEDWTAAVRLAVNHLSDAVGDAPLYLVGYSNGGALAVLYALECVGDESRPKVDGIVLISPAIGVSSMAALAAWQGRLGRVFGLHKLAWNSIRPEYDPYKYGSFAINAGHQSRRLTIAIHAGVLRAEEAGTLSDFPPVLAFQSIVDATVSTRALLTGLMDQLPAGGGHELVLFDINRRTDMEPVLVHDPKRDIDELLEAISSFTLTLITNASDASDAVKLRVKRPGRPVVDQPLDLTWPEELYSLSHVAMPIRRDDPLYGPEPSSHESPMLQLGRMALRGERGVLRIPAAELMRLRWNPFYDYLESRSLDFMGFDPTAGAASRPADG